MTLRNSIVWGGAVVGLAIILAASYALLNKGPQKTQTSYAVTDQSRPRAQLNKTSADLGKMKVSEDKSYDFTMKNIGKKPLRLFNISSSCGCTFGQVIYNGVTSEKFGMHTKSAYQIEIPPQKKAVIRVTYSPSIMPVYGPVEREVYIKTNDPENPTLTFIVKAVVQ